MTDVPWSQTSSFPPAADGGASRGQRRAAQERGGVRRGAEGADTMGKTPWSWGPIHGPGTPAVPTLSRWFGSDRRLREAAEVMCKNKSKGRVLLRQLACQALNTHALQVNTNKP